MLTLARNLFRFPSLLSLSALALILVATAQQPALAQGTHLWTQSRMEEFERGTPQGVAISSDGTLREGPGLTELLTTPSSFVWSVAEDKDGTAYVGTASPATVLRVGKDGKAFTLFETKELSVQVVKLGPDGALYAATLPGGRVYRLKADATAKQDETNATVVFDAAKLDGAKTDGSKATGSHYIWDLSFDAAGRLYIATGGPGAVYRVDAAKTGTKPELFFKSDEQHIRALAWDAAGNLIAGSDGSGLIYRIDAQGKGYVLFEAPRREITAVAVDAKGRIYAASVGDKSHNPLPPLPIQGSSNGMITITVGQPGSLQAANTSASVPEGSEIYELENGQAPRKLWSGKDEIVYALAAREDEVVALTGNQGRIFRIGDDGSYADLGHLQAQQGLSLATNANGMLIGTGNTGKLFRLDTTKSHEYASDVLDAGALARFGRVEIEPGATGFEIYTRSGNVEQPVRGWTEWAALKDGKVASPAGRYLQWKVALQEGGSVSSVGVNYLPVNAAPVVDEAVVAPGARWSAQSQISGQPQTINITFSSSNQTAMSYDASANTPLQAVKDRTAVTVRWAAHDDNGDTLSYSLYLRGDGERVWRLLKDKISEQAYSFDAALIPDGGYQIKVVATDAPSHTPGESLTGAKVSERFEVDTTPPVVTNLKAVLEESQCLITVCGQPVGASFEAEDGFSPIARAEYSVDAGAWQFIEPVGGLSDSKREHYEVKLSLKVLEGEIGEHLITVRVYDRHENVAVAKTVFSSAAKTGATKTGASK